MAPYKPQPTPDAKREEEKNDRNQHVQMNEKHKEQLPLPQARWSNAKRNE